MESYDEVIGFDYTSKEEWKKWIKEIFLHLYKQLCAILNGNHHLVVEESEMKIVEGN